MLALHLNSHFSFSSTYINKSDPYSEDHMVLSRHVTDTQIPNTQSNVQDATLFTIIFT